MADSPFLSIIIPVYNGGNAFVRCLTAIKQSGLTDWELIVVDDGSDDRSADLAEEIGATVLRTGGKLGPAAARNLGAQIAQGEYLCFIDADCEVHPNTLAEVVRMLKRDPEIDALFGSYDDAPAASNFIAQYKNLFHHYVHQTGNEDASTFWAGCGVIKRSMFLALGGFDVQRYPRPTIEDIDLGYRIKQVGGKIHLAKHVQVKHHKAWTLLSMIKSDVLDRGIPWTRLMLSSKTSIDDLNLRTHGRISVLAVYALLLCNLISLQLTEHRLYLESLSAILAIGAFILLVNLDLYRFFYRKRGTLFVFGAIPLHWLYYTYCLIAYLCGVLLYWWDQFKKRTIAPSEPLADDRVVPP